MTAFILKIIAILTMTVDHVGAVFSMQTPFYFRYIGRIAFPIYVFLISEGSQYSKDLKKYMTRLGIFAIISQIPFDLAFHQSYNIIKNQPLRFNFLSGTNVYYTLFLGVACIFIYNNLANAKNIYLALIPFFILPASIFFINNTNFKTIISIIFLVYLALILILTITLPKEDSQKINFSKLLVLVTVIVPIICIADLLSTDYGMFGVTFIFLVSLFKKKSFKLILMFLGIFYLYELPAVSSILMLNQFNFIDIIKQSMFFIFALISLVLLFFYNGKQGPKLKCFFYWYYPLHLSVLAFIWLLIVRPALYLK